MTKVWYCRTCGYEVNSRGKCHRCRQKLLASPLAELAPTGNDDDEVGYRLDAWSDRGRGRLIEALIEAEIPHRFEEDELVVAAEDEERVDDLSAALGLEDDLDEESLDGPDDDEADVDDDELVGDEPADDIVVEALELLCDAAARLRADPTDMQADADVAEVSAVVFVADDYAGTDPDTWSAIGRVTRRLLGALGAEEALEDDIRRQSGILVHLLEPIVSPAVSDGSEESISDVESADSGELTVYELPQWLPEQRADLSLLLDEAGVAHQWDKGDLLVPASDEAKVESLFDDVEGVTTEEEDDEIRYHALEELFAAADRLAKEPEDELRRRQLLDQSDAAEGPTPVGLDEATWLRIRQRARIVADAVEHDADTDLVSTEAASLRDLLRPLM